MRKLATLYHPVGQKEYELIRDSGFASFPPRLPHQPIFYPVLTEGYSIQIARDWNTKDAASGYVGYVPRFQIAEDFLARYPIQKVGNAEALEYWIPVEALDEFNRRIIGRIEVLHEFRAGRLHVRATDEKAGKKHKRAAKDYGPAPILRSGSVFRSFRL